MGIHCCFWGEKRLSWSSCFFLFGVSLGDHTPYSGRPMETSGKITNSTQSVAIMYQEELETSSFSSWNIQICESVTTEQKNTSYPAITTLKHWDDSLRLKHSTREQKHQNHPKSWENPPKINNFPWNLWSLVSSLTAKSQGDRDSKPPWGLQQWDHPGVAASIQRERKRQGIPSDTPPQDNRTAHRFLRTRF